MKLRILLPSFVLGLMAAAALAQPTHAQGARCGPHGGAAWHAAGPYRVLNSWVVVKPQQDRWGQVRPAEFRRERRQLRRRNAWGRWVTQVVLQDVFLRWQPQRTCNTPPVRRQSSWGRTQPPQQGWGQPAQPPVVLYSGPID